MRLSPAVLSAALLSRSVCPSVLPPGDYDASVPTMREVVGSNPGEKMLSYAEILAYAKSLDAASDKVRLLTDGQTSNGRVLMYLCVSDPSILDRLDDVAAATRAVREAKGSFPPDQPLTVAIYAAIHGDELSSAEASLALAYYFAASRSQENLDLLKHEIVIIDPLQNPDGRERFLAYYESMKLSTPLADQNAAEHGDFWPSGRGNGSFFDMNRDWYMQTQPETRVRVARYLDRLPLVIADLHEMGGNSSYYFPPPSEPTNTNIQPELLKLYDTFGRAIAGAFDRKGFTYYSGEVFDEFFPGYGSSLPLYLGTLGMTYEMASPGGLLFRKSSGDVMTYEDAVARHFTAALTTCRTAFQNREGILDAYARIQARAMEKTPQAETQAYVFPPQTGVEQMASVLRSLGVSIKQLGATFEPKSTTPIGFPPDERKPGFPAGSIVIPLNQPSRFLLKALIEPRAVMPDRFIDEERLRKEHRLPSEIYDVTAWSLPLSFDLAGSAIAGGLPPLSDWSGPARGEIREIGSGEPYAYLVDYSQNGAPAVAAALLADGFRVEIAEKELRAGGVSFSRGTYVVRVAPNGGELRQKLQASLARCGVIAYATPTGYTENSIDLGSDHVRRLRSPEIAVLMDTPVSSTSYGAVRWLLEQQYGIPFTPIRVSSVADCDLRLYRTIVIPDSAGDSLGRVLGDAGAQKLRRWTEMGGTLVGVGGACEMLLGDTFKLSGGKVMSTFKKGSVEPPPKKKDEKVEEPEVETEPPSTIPGAFYEAALDTLDWLTAGYGESVPVYLNSKLVLDWPTQTNRCVARFPKSPKIAGFSWEIDDRRLEGKAYLVRADIEDGCVILFADEPYFRGYLRGLDRLFLNAVFNGASYAKGLNSGPAREGPRGLEQR